VSVAPRTVCEVPCSATSTSTQPGFGISSYSSTCVDVEQLRHDGENTLAGQPSRVRTSCNIAITEVSSIMSLAAGGGVKVGSSREGWWYEPARVSARHEGAVRCTQRHERRECAREYAHCCQGGVASTADKVARRCLPRVAGETQQRCGPSPSQLGKEDALGSSCA